MTRFHSRPHLQWPLYIMIVLALTLISTASHAQLLGLYGFDGGGDGTSWDDATNWEQVLDPFGNPISGDPATPPDAITSADLPSAGVVIDNTMLGQTALNVNIGTAAGPGSLTISAGDLTHVDLSVGRDAVNGNPGSMDVSGGTLITGDDIAVRCKSCLRQGLRYQLKHWNCRS